MRDQSPLINSKITDFLTSVLHCAFSGHLMIINSDKDIYGRVTIHGGHIVEVHLPDHKDCQFTEERLIEPLSWPNMTYEWVELNTPSKTPIDFSIIDIKQEADTIQESLACINFEATRCRQFLEMRTALLPFTLQTELSSGQTFENTVENTPLIIGRDAEAHITLDNPNVSRKHAELTMTPNGMWISDLGSSNGTYLNDYKIASYDLFPYNFKDIITIGPYTIKPTARTRLRASILKSLALREMRLLSRKRQTISGIELEPLIKKYTESKNKKNTPSDQLEPKVSKELNQSFE